MKVAIVGGGPAGIAAAIAVKQGNPKCDVYIIEKQAKIGGKIPLTGNGRCNLSNVEMSVQDYYFDKTYKKIIASILADFDLKLLKKFLLTAGIITVEEAGRIYPASRKASQVRDALENLVIELGITVISASECCDIDIANNNFLVTYKNKENTKASLRVDRLVLATGSPASLKRITDNNSLYLANKCQLSNKDFFPALTGYICDEKYDKSLAGVRARASIICGSLQEYGEIQFTEEGISGIPTFQLSLSIAEKVKKGNIKLSVDFLYDISDDLIDQWIDTIRDKQLTSIEELLSGLVNPKIANSVLTRCKISGKTAASKLSDNKIKTLISSLKAYDIAIKEVMPLTNSQVALGGLLLGNLDDNLQSIDCLGLYSCGEILDIAGRCGGYNLHFAFASGWRVGKAILGTINV